MINQTYEKYIVPMNYLYVRSLFLCKYKNTDVRIINICPIGYKSYNVSKEDAVNMKQIADQCGSVNGRIITEQNIQELYDVDVLLEIEQRNLDNHEVQYYTTNNSIAFACSAIGFVILIGMVFVIQRFRMRDSRTKLNKLVHKVNPLNQVPVVVPWTKSDTTWSVADIIPRNNPTEFEPMRIRSVKQLY